jgi:hypothetical protein
VGPDGNAWATEKSGQILKINLADGSVIRYRLPDNTSPQQITTGPDGNLWFVGLQGASSPVSIIGRVVPTSGAITIFNHPDPSAFTFGGAIEGASDGKVYVVNPAHFKIGIIDAAASTTSLVMPEFSPTFGLTGLLNIAAPRTGGIVFCGKVAPKCGTMNSSGQVVVSFALPTSQRPTGVAECMGNKVCVITASGTNSTLWIGDVLQPGGFASFSDPLQHIDIGSPSFNVGGINCATSLDGSEACITAANSDVIATDLTTSAPKFSSVGVPAGNFVVDARFFRTHDVQRLSILAIGHNPATNESGVFFGVAVRAATPTLTATKAVLAIVPASRHIVFNVVVENTSDVEAAAGVTITDQAPDSTEILAVTSVTSDGQVGVCNKTQTSVSCTDPFSIPPHGRFSVQVSVTTLREGTIRNTARIDGGGDPTNPKNTNTVEATQTAPPRTGRTPGRRGR